MNIHSFILILILLAIFIGERIWHEKRIDKLLNRLMARNFDEFKYYEKKFDNDLKQEQKYYREVEKSIFQEEGAGKGTGKIEGFQDGEPTSLDLESLEEDWAEEEALK